MGALIQLRKYVAYALGIIAVLLFFTALMPFVVSLFSDSKIDFVLDIPYLLHIEVKHPVK